MDPSSRSRPPRRRQPRGWLHVTVTDGRGRVVLAPGLASWLVRIAPATARGEIGVALVSDARIRSLNKRYRRKDRTTDVLSFEPSDIAIATGVARRQARQAGHSYATELKVLALHGLLHLLGYDHHSPADRRRMARVEHALRRQGGLRAGLIERARTHTATRRSGGAKRHGATARAQGAPHANGAGNGVPASARVGGTGGAKRHGATARVQGAPHAHGAGNGVPASARVGGTGGAKPPGK